MVQQVRSRMQFTPGVCWIMMMMVMAMMWSSCITRVQLVGAALPEPVEQCGVSRCTLPNAFQNAYGLWNDSRSTCKAASVVYPSTEQEILDAMATAVRSNQKIKVSTTYGHSIPKLACPGSSSGFIINSKKYTAIVNIDTTKSTATAQGCIQLRSLVDAVATHGLALPVALYWDGVTLAGVLSTGAHGSSLLWKGGAVHEYVIGMRLVTPASAGEGYAKIRVLGRDDKELNAAKLSLRMLGVISTVILQLESTYERSVTKNLAAEEDGMEDEILRIGQTEEFEDVIWYPALGEVVYRDDHRVPANEAGDGKNSFVEFQELWVSLLATSCVPTNLNSITSKSISSLAHSEICK